MSERRTGPWSDVVVDPIEVLDDPTAYVIAGPAAHVAVSRKWNIAGTGGTLQESVLSLAGAILLFQKLDARRRIAEEMA